MAAGGRREQHEEWCQWNIVTISSCATYTPYTWRRRAWLVDVIHVRVVPVAVFRWKSQPTTERIERVE